MLDAPKDGPGAVLHADRDWESFQGSAYAVALLSDGTYS